MARVRVAVSAEVDAPAPRVYSVIADYHGTHPRILPGHALRNLVVESGGTGAGTIIRFELHALGRVMHARSEIREPEPGRVLEEVDLGPRRAVTTFTVDPLGPARSRVTIATEVESPPLRALVERVVLPRVLEPIYREQLANLGRVASEPLT